MRITTVEALHLRLAQIKLANGFALDIPCARARGGGGE
jgi:hypothetical protein